MLAKRTGGQAVGFLRDTRYRVKIETQKLLINPGRSGDLPTRTTRAVFLKPETGGFSYFCYFFSFFERANTPLDRMCYN